MTALSHHETVVFLLSLALLLGTARILGELALRFQQPAVLGELLAGILLGPTVLGSVAPKTFRFFFPADGNISLALSSLSNLAIILFLLVVGMEVDLSTIWRQGKAALSIGVMGIVVPFGLGFVAAILVPNWMGSEGESPAILFALFVATALSISALPVIAKTLIDLNLFRTDMGMSVIAAAIFNDLIGWMIFAVILAMMGQQPELAIHYTILLTLSFMFLVLTVGRWLIDRSLPWILAHASWPGGILGFTLTATLLCAAITEWIGIHAIFGAFIFGIVLGDSRHFRQPIRATLDQFISFIFAPLFFAGIGLRVDFVGAFDLGLVVTIFLVASVGKIVGCGLAARWAGFPSRESWATGFAMNSRGVMEIILGLLALEVGLIGERLFVALVIMALVTSMMSGTLIQFCMDRRRSLRFTDYMPARVSFLILESRDCRESIHELVKRACQHQDLDHDFAQRLVWSRESVANTYQPQGLAVPHGRLENLERPLVIVGVSRNGIPWIPAGETGLAYLVVLLLTPKPDNSIHLQILDDVIHTFRHQQDVQVASRAKSFTEFLALVNTELRSNKSSSS